MEKDDNFHTWQSRMVPLMYDCFYHHNLHWPTQACRWGAMLEDSTFKSKYRLYFSEQTDGSEPQKLIAANVDVMKAHVCSSEVVSAWQEFQRCPYIKDQKVIYHPGEVGILLAVIDLQTSQVNKIREIPQHPELLVTHTDSPELFLWNMDKQPNRGRDKVGGKSTPASSVADLRLVGHEDNALFPLGTSAVAPFVASGGSDKLVLLWALQDSMETLLAGGGSKGKSPELAARTTLRGHTDTIEDVVFKPDSTQQLVSVGDDEMILFWDTRAGEAPSKSITDAHGKGQDIQCVDWEGHQGNLVATGAMDGSLRIWDVRKLGSAADCVKVFTGMHSGGIIRLEWHPHEQGVFASGGEDKLINVWRLNADVSSGTAAAASEGPSNGESAPPQELIFQHAGHRRGKVVDFHWNRNPGLPWTMVSVSDDAEDEQIGGGSLQIWRINHLIYKDEDEVIAELEKHKNFVLNGENPPELEENLAKREAALQETEGVQQAAPAAAADGGASTEPAVPASAPEEAAAAAGLQGPGSSAAVEQEDLAAAAVAAAAAAAAAAAEAMAVGGAGAGDVGAVAQMDVDNGGNIGEQGGDAMQTE